MLYDLFSGSRGSEALANAFNIGGYLESISKWLALIIVDFFYEVMPIVFIGLAALIGYSIFKGHFKQDDSLSFVNILGLSVLLYLLVIFKIAPYIVFRYICIVFPIAYMILLFYFKKSTAFLSKKVKRGAFVAFFPVMFVLVLHTYATNPVPYVMKEGESIKMASEHADVPALALFGKGKWMCYYSFDELMGMDNIYMHYGLNENPVEEKVWEEIAGSECVVFVSPQLDQEETIAYVKEAGGFTSVEELFENTNHAYLFSRDAL